MSLIKRLAYRSPLGASLTLLLAAAVGDPTAAAAVDPTLTFTNVNSTKCVDVTGASRTDGGNVEQYHCTGGANQQWTAHLRLQDSIHFYYELVNLNSGKCLDVYNASTNDGANVQQFRCTGRDNQQWYIRSSGPGGREIVNRQTRPNSQGRPIDLCLDVSNASVNDGANIQQFRCTGNENQKWAMHQVS